MNSVGADADRAGEGPAAGTASDCARELLEAIRAGGDPEPYLATLAGYGAADLERVRTDRTTALAFWLNLYNAGTQLLLERRPELYESSLRAVRFFRATCLTVAGTELSLDDIEQGILRGSRSKYGLGYLPRLAGGAFERRYRLAEPDPRIHFALNCGAASCPAIRSFSVEAVDDQLETATEVYLDGEVEYDPERGVARLPRVFLWYRGDFGGASGIRSFLREYDAVPAGAEPTLRYRSWNWSREAGKFAD